MTDKQTSIQSTNGVRTWLVLMSFVVILGSLALVVASISGGSNFLMMAITLGVFLIGLTAASLFWSMASLLNQLEISNQQQQELKAHIGELGKAPSQQVKHAEAAPAVASAPSAAPAPAASRVPEGYQIMPDVYPLLDALHEVRDILLMSDEQRAAFRKQQELARRQQTIEAIHAALEQGMWEMASARMADLAADDPAREDIHKRVATLREEARAKSISYAREQLHHLMAIGEWVRADEIAAGLVAQYPDDPEARELAMIEKREHDAYVREQINRMFVELKSASESKDWRRALLLAENLVSRYPNDPEISRLQLDLPMLRENADAQERRDEEALFKNLLLSQRYDEALQVAQRVLNRFPGTPTAVELEKLLPKVRQLAEKR